MSAVQALIAESKNRINYQTKILSADVEKALLEVLEHNATASSEHRIGYVALVKALKADFGLCVTRCTLRKYLIERYGVEDPRSPTSADIEAFKSKMRVPPTAARRSKDK